MNGEIIKIKLKKGKIKINASLSALCSAHGLVPTKVVKQFVDISEKSLIDKFYVNLHVEEGDFKVTLAENPDASYVKTLVKEVNKQQLLKAYAEKTIHKSTAKSVETRFKELKGLMQSFQ